VRKTDIAGHAVGELAEILAEGPLERELRVERHRHVTGDQGRAAVLAGKDAHLVAVRGEPGAITEGELELRTVGQHRLLHVSQRRPALDAALGAHLEPVGAAEQHVHALIARHGVEHRVAAARPGMQLEVGLRHEQLQVLGCGAYSGGE